MAEIKRTGTITSYVMISDVEAACGPVLGYLSEVLYRVKATYWLAASIMFLLALQWILIRTRMSLALQIRNNNNKATAY